MKEDRTFSDDIKRAENAVLVFSWFGVVSALIVIGYSFWGLM